MQYHEDLYYLSFCSSFSKIILEIYHSLSISSFNLLIILASKELIKLLLHLVAFLSPLIFNIDDILTHYHIWIGQILTSIRIDLLLFLKHSRLIDILVQLSLFSIPFEIALTLFLNIVHILSLLLNLVVSYLFIDFLEIPNRLEIKALNNPVLLALFIQILLIIVNPFLSDLLDLILNLLITNTILLQLSLPITRYPLIDLINPTSIRSRWCVMFLVLLLTIVLFLILIDVFQIKFRDLRVLVDLRFKIIVEMMGCFIVHILRMMIFPSLVTIDTLETDYIISISTFIDTDKLMFSYLTFIQLIVSFFVLNIFQFLLYNCLFLLHHSTYH